MKNKSICFRLEFGRKKMGILQKVLSIDQKPQERQLFRKSDLIDNSNHQT